MKKLEKFIHANRNAFEQEPDVGHFERFLARMEKRKGTTKPMSYLTGILKVAAIVVLVVISSIWGFDKIFLQHEEGISLGELSPEYNEVEQYFVFEVNQKYREIDDSDFFADSLQKIVMMKELKEMDSIYNSMKVDLKTNPDNERVINAMIEHYQLKLDIMNHILNQLHDIKANNKQTDHENTDI